MGSNIEARGRASDLEPVPSERLSFQWQTPSSAIRQLTPRGRNVQVVIVSRARPRRHASPDPTSELRHLAPMRRRPRTFGLAHRSQRTLTIGR